MKSHDIFPGKYLKAADLGDKEPIVTVDRVVMETLGDDLKPVVYFKGKERGIVLNKTNFSTLVDLSGKEDSDDWKGTQVKLYAAKVEYQGKRVLGIRMDAPTTRSSRRVVDVPPPEPPDEFDLPDASDDPF